MRRRALSRSIPVIVLLTVASGDSLWRPVARAQTVSHSIAPDPVGPAIADESELRDLVERYTTDRFTLTRRYPMQQSPERFARFKKYYGDWQTRLAAMNVEPLSVEGRVDYVLLRNRIEYDLKLLTREEQWLSETSSLLPFLKTIADLNDARIRMDTLDPKKAAATLEALAASVEKLQRAVEAGLGPGSPRPRPSESTETTGAPSSAEPSRGPTNGQQSGPNGQGQGQGRRRGGAPDSPGGAIEPFDNEGDGNGEQAAAPTQESKDASASDKAKPTPLKPTKLIAYRAQEAIGDLSLALRNWYEYYSGYDPLFTWWNAAPYKKATRNLESYRRLLRERVVGFRSEEDEPIVGTPIGREALASDLASEFVDYTPEELLAIGEREFAWCENELKKASHDMGLGDDWKVALEKVKNLYVEPGKQPDLIRDLAREAENYVEQHDLITVPPLAKEMWRMQMMSPARQKVNPFFTGGEMISVSYPTDTMDHDDKMMSMRGNNIHFARATVFHELIPGHELQAFMNARYNTHRGAFRTGFWTEGWSLYWEMLLWDMGFQQSPENRIGMLFWRIHRASRILFSLNFHLGKWTPQQCIDFLVEKGGHERANAEAEVRRSFNGSYPPLYQLAYMMGGLQIKALHHDLVDSGKMTNRQFHDAIITGGPMPIEMVRARLTKQMLPKDYKASWKFAGELRKSAGN
jgi:hypothetical protein